VSTTALVVDGAGASTVDLSTGSTSTFEAPEGGTFAEVAGGKRVLASDGAQYIVGGTRASGGPSARILVIDADGKATFAALTAAREGACATWVDGRGLVVYGGDAAAPGAEVLATKATIAAPLPFAPDPVRGCAAATLDSGHVAIAGGASETPVRVLDLACAAGCAPAAWPDRLPLVRAEATRLAADAVFVLGDDAAGASHAFRVTSAGSKEIPIRVPRRGARLVAAPLGTVVLGGAAGIEQYVE